MKNYTEVIEYIETVLNGNGIEITEIEDLIVTNKGDDPYAGAMISILIPLRCIPNE